MGPEQKKRLVKAFIIAPLSGPALFAVGVSALGALTSIGAGEIKKAGIVLTGAPIWFLFGVPVSYLVTLVLGVPAYYYFHTRLGVGYAEWVLAAAIVGAVAGLIVALSFQLFDMEWVVGYMLFGAVFGAVTGYTFWRLAVKPPNQSLKQGPRKQRAAS